MSRSSLHEFLADIRTTLEVAEQDNFLCKPGEFVNIPHDESVDDECLLHHLARFVRRYKTPSHLQRVVRQFIRQTMHFKELSDFQLWCFGDQLKLSSMGAYKWYMGFGCPSWRRGSNNPGWHFECQEDFIQSVKCSMNWMKKGNFCDFEHKYQRVLEEVGKYLIPDLASIVLEYDWAFFIKKARKKIHSIFTLGFVKV